MKRIFYVACAALVGAGSAQALIVNGSFEDGPNPGSFTLYNGNPFIPGWSIDSGSVDYIGTYWEHADGERSLDLSGNNAASISQVVSTQVGMIYTVSFALAGNPVGPPVVKTMQVSVDNATNTSANYTFDTEGTTRANMGWVYKEFSFTATDESTKLSFASLDGGFFGPALDDVSMQAIPEPATLLALGLGAAAVAARRRRRQG